MLTSVSPLSLVRLAGKPLDKACSKMSICPCRAASKNLAAKAMASSGSSDACCCGGGAGSIMCVGRIGRSNYCQLIQVLDSLLGENEGSNGRCHKHLTSTPCREIATHI